MAAAGQLGSQSWRSLLNEHPICKYLRKNLATGTSKQQSKDAKNLICIKTSDLFVWSSTEGCILHCNLKALATAETESTKSKGLNTNTSNSGASGEETYLFQRLLPSDVISFDVESIIVNDEGTHILVYGLRGVMVIELPRRWGKNAGFEGGKQTVSCRSVSVCHSRLTRSPSLKVLQGRWHPDSTTGSLVALLTSDNKFFVYNIQNPEHPFSEAHICSSDPTFDSSPGKSLVGVALGEVAVAFDFGTPVTVQCRSKATSFDHPAKSEEVEVWPVYFVRGNGAVMLLYSHVSLFRRMEFPIQGPLSMFPPADDNYGVDACSIVVLSSSVPIVVISTCEGRIHHCVQLEGDQHSVQYQPNESNTSVHLSPPNEPMLYVIETAVLDLTLAPPGVDDLPGPEFEFMCPVLLKKDNNSPDRYHCSHSAGVHTVALPWLSHVQQFFLGDNPDFDLTEEKECVVEHVLCTKPLYSCPTSPVLGLDVVTDPLLGASLVIMSSSLEMTVLPIGLQYLVTGSSVHSGASTSDAILAGQGGTGGRESFKKQMERILHRNVSVPVLKSSGTSELSQRDMFQILTRVTSVLREEYIHKLDLARQAMASRVSMLEQRKLHQMSDVKTLLEERSTLQGNATSIADKLESCRESHEALLRRLEGCLRKLQSKVPVLSEAERKEMKELKAIKGNMAVYAQNIDQLRVKQEYQARQIQQEKGGGDSGKSLGLREMQVKQIKQILQDEAGDIEELKKDIGRLTLGLS